MNNLTIRFSTTEAEELREELSDVQSKLYDMCKENDELTVLHNCAELRRYKEHLNHNKEQADMQSQLLLARSQRDKLRDENKRIKAGELHGNLLDKINRARDILNA